MKMKVKIQGSKAKSRKAILRSVLRWLLYAAVLLVFYACECNPLIRGFCPLLIIPLASSVVSAMSINDQAEQLAPLPPGG